MRLLIFLPSEASFAAQRDEVLAKYGALKRIRLADLEGSAEERRTALADAMRSAGKDGWVILDPPQSVDELADIDRLCLEVYGRKRRSLPRAIFFAPRPPKKKQPDPYEAYRATFKERFRHYHKDRRSLTYERAAAKQLRKKVKLAGKAHSPIRWALLGPMALAFVALLLLLFTFRDPLLRRATVSTGQSAFGAVVEVADLSTTLTPSLSLAGVAVADRDEPMQNRFEFERFATGVDLVDLLGGRLHLTEASLEGLAFGTPRETSGALPEDEPVAVGRPGEDDPTRTEQLANLARYRIDLVIDRLAKKLEPPSLDELKTTHVARELEEEAQRRLARLETRTRDNPVLAELRASREELQTLLEDPLPESFRDVQARIDDLGDLGSSARIDAMKAELARVGAIDFSAEEALVDQAKAELETAEREVKEARDALEAAVELEEVDFRTLLKLAQIKKDVEAAIETLKGAKARVENARQLVQTAQANLKSKRSGGDERLAELRSSLADLGTDGEASGGPGGLGALKDDLETARRDVAARKERATRLLTDMRSQLEALRGEADAIRAMLADDREFLREGAARLRAAAEQDRADLAARYSLEAFDAEEIVAALVGEGTYTWIRRIYDVYDGFRPYLESRKGEPEVRPAPQGVTYDFPDEPSPGAEPGFWLETVRFAGTLPVADEPFDLSGEARDVSSSPRLLDRAAELDFTARLGERGLEGALRFTPDETFESRVELTGFSFDDVELDGRYAPERVAGDDVSAVLEATFDPGRVRASVELRIGAMRLSAPEDEDLDPRLGPLLADVYGRFDALEARLDVALEDGELTTMKVTSNVGEELRSVVNTALAREVEAASAEMRAGLDERLAGASEGALSAIEAFGPRGEELLGAFTSDVGAAESAAAGDASRLESLLASLDLPSLDGGGLSDEALAAAKAELEAGIQRETSRLTSAHDARASAIDALLGDLASTDASAGSAQDALANELRRLLKLR